MQLYVKQQKRIDKMLGDALAIAKMQEYAKKISDLACKGTEAKIEQMIEREKAKKKK